MLFPVVPNTESSSIVIGSQECLCRPRSSDVRMVLLAFNPNVVRKGAKGLHVDYPAGSLC
jgi:hypothetical protein